MLLLLTPAVQAANPQVVRYLQQPEDSIRFSYQYQLIEQLMASTVAEFGPYQLEPYTGTMESRRLNREAIRGERINLMWSDAGHADLDNQMIRIPFPLLKGLLGYRIFLIRKQDQPRFSAIRTLDELKKLRLGQGANWGDLRIYRHNGFQVITGERYESLFHMLVSNRFDYFPRGVNEAPLEYAALHAQHPDLAIEQTLLLVYRYPVFFYVSRNSPELARRLQSGLEQMQADGRFDRFFFNYYRPVLEQANLPARRVFYLDNPFLPADTPLKRPELWLDPLKPLPPAQNETPKKP
jgi:ABC-type amino acid transport/signal transduction systems, periplasmic component/domain